MLSISEDVRIQEFLYINGKTVDWCSCPRKPSTSIDVLSQNKYTHTYFMM